MDKAITIVLKDIKLKLEKTNIVDKKKDKYKEQINSLIEKYREMEVADNHIETYDSLVKKGRELIKDNVKDEGKLKYYLRYCDAAIFDFEGKVRPLGLIIRMFLISCALFLVLAPQYFGAIFPLIFLVPAYIGLRGMKKRVDNGLKMCLSVMPMALMTAVVCLRMTLLASRDFGTYVSNWAASNKIAESTASYLIIGSGVLGFILLVTSLTTIYMGYKYRKMFI